MGFTIQDMMISSGTQYQMELVAGANGWSNSISWVLMIEDTAIIRNFSGKELVVTTGLGFDSGEKLVQLAQRLVTSHAAGLIINTGEYIKEIPRELKLYCDENDLPLIDVPWHIYLADMIKDLSIRIFLQGTADEQIANALIHAIEKPDNPESYRKELLPYYDVDGEFQVVLFTTPGLDEMDTVERRKLGHRLQIYLENITHNGNFFYYDANFVLMMNDVSQRDFEEIVAGMIRRAKKRLPDTFVYVGTGSRVRDLSNLHISYKRAKAAVEMARQQKETRVDFDQMGMFRLLYSIEDKQLLTELGPSLLQPLLDYDSRHNGNYIEMLELYLRYNGSIQAVAEKTFTHRNTVIYRINNIKKILGNDLEDMEERFQYLVALQILKINGIE